MVPSLNKPIKITMAPAITPSAGIAEIPCFWITGIKITVIAPGIAIIDPTAFTAATLSFIREHYDTIEATPDEVLDVQVNTLVLGPDRLAMSATAHRLAEAVSTKGIEPVLIDVDEITKLPGSLRCITLPLHRERREQEPHGERPAVAHEDLGGVEVVR